MAKQKTLPRSFWGFYRSLAKSALAEGYDVLDGFLTLVAVAVFVVTLFNKEVAHQLESQWQGLSRWYSIIPLIAWFGYRVMKANYAHFEEVLQHADSLGDELRVERDKILQPDVALVWDWREDVRHNQRFLSGTEKDILIHNRSSEYIYNVRIEPVQAFVVLSFDTVPSVAPGEQHLAVGRWISEVRGPISSSETNYAYYFAAIEADATEKGWYQRKPHNRGLSNAWFKIPMVIRYQARGVEWMVKFELTHDIGDESYFTRLTGMRA